MARAPAAVLSLALFASAPQGSLEAYLARAQRESALRVREIESEVRALLEGAGKPLAEAERERALGRLAEIGPDAALLVVAHLDPGDEASGEDQARADFAAEALQRMAPEPALGELERILEHGSSAARLRAITVLPAMPEAPGVRATLNSVFAGSSGELRGAALRALLALGGPEAEAQIPEILSGSDWDLIEIALSGLAELDRAVAAPLVAALFHQPWRAERFARGLLTYYRAFPELVDDEVAEGLARLTSGGAPAEVKLEVLAALPDIAPRLASLRRVLEPVIASGPLELREGAQAALAILGDRAARRALLEPYDAAVDGSKRRPEAWARRADVQMRIRDYGAAIRDYRQALELSEGSIPDPATYIDLARCYARERKLQDAAQWLRRAPITLEELRALAADPDFAELSASKWGREAFALGEPP
jgi:tetratricopeptide (TPR) repeat protein